METERKTCLTCGQTYVDADGSGSLHCQDCRRARDSASLENQSTLSDEPQSAALSDLTVLLPDTDATVDSPQPGNDAETLTSRREDGPPLDRTEFGRFLIVGQLGEGGFGRVYRARDPLLDRDVALKVSKCQSTDPSIRERFHREARAAARLHHPNIVAVYESGTTDDWPYLISEIVEGATLKDVMLNRRFDVRQAVDWVRQLAEALYYAHLEKVIHRDIKPANIMINRMGRPQIMDFGLAKREIDQESSVTMEGQIVGTPSYMSPEQARGMIAEIGPHSDQYSLGVVLYELLCGTTPFLGPPVVVLSRVGNVNDLPPTPRTLAPQIPRDLEACCLKAIEKDPSRRYANLAQFADDLDHWLKGLPLRARPIGPLESLVRWCRKNRLVATLGGTLATVLLLMAILGPWLAIRFKSLADASARDATAANNARSRETAALTKELNARLDTERVLIDNYTESGLTADRRGDPRAALLYFANAVHASGNHPARDRHNRIRVHSWLNQMPIPTHAFPQPAQWNKHLSHHPTEPALLTVADGGQADWIDLATDHVHPLVFSGPVTAAQWSPDGKSLAVASERDVAILSHPAGKILQRWETSAPVHVLRYTADGQRLVQGTVHSVLVRDVTAQANWPETFEVERRVLSLEISPEDRYFAVRTDAQKVHTFPLITGQPPAPVIPPQTAESEGEVIPYFVAPASVVIADGSRNALRCWDLATRQILWEEPAGRVLAMAQSPNRQWLAAADNSVVLVLDTSLPRPRIIRIPHRNLVYGMAFDPRSRRLVTTGNDQTIQLFELPSGRPLCAAIPNSTAGHRCVWNPDGTSFATVNWGGGLIRVWKATGSNDDAAAGTISGPFVRCHPKGDCWLVSGFDGRRDRHGVEIVEAATAQSRRIPIAETTLISDADFIPGSDRVVVAGGHGAAGSPIHFREQHPDSPGFVQILSTREGGDHGPEVPTPTQPIAVRVAPDGGTAVVLCHRGQVLLIETTGPGRILATVEALGGGEATHGYVIRDRIRIAPQGDQFALWGHADFVELRDLRTAGLTAVLKHRRDFIHDVQFSPDGSRVASCSSDHSVCVWDAKSGHRIGQAMEHPGWIFSSQFSRDGQFLLTACDDRHARVWDVTRQQMRFVTTEHTDQVFGVCTLPGDELFLACDRSGQITAWELTYGKMIAPPRKLPGMVYQLTLTGAGDQVIASGRLEPCRRLAWRDWIREPHPALSRDDIRLLGELASCQSIHEGGAVTSLTTAEWLARWNQFHSNHSLRKIAGPSANPKGVP